MSVEIKLAPIETIGRKMQYAFLSYALYKGIEFDIKYQEGKVVFNQNDFVDLVSEVKDVVFNSVVWERGEDICTSKFDQGPKLYTSGRSDLETLSSYGLTMCEQLVTTSESEEEEEEEGKKKGKGKKKASNTSWTRAALKYADMVINNSRSVSGDKEVNMVQLATVTLFSEKNLRGPINVRRRRVSMTVNFDGLGVILLGGLLSYQGKYSLKQSQGKDKQSDVYEFLLLPDSYNKAFINLRNLAIVTTNNSIASLVRWLIINFSGISYEVALSMALATKLAYEAKTVDYLENEGSISSAKLYLVLPQKYRPMLVQANPLDLTIAKTYSNDTIKYINEIARKVVSSQREDKQGAVSAVSDCINYMNLQAISPCSTEFLAGCLRELEQIDATGFGIDFPLKEFKANIYEDYERMVKECH